MKPMSETGDGAIKQYMSFETFALGLIPRCTLVDYMTDFSIYDRDDYKRCICTFYGLGQFDCEQEEPKC